MASIYPVLVGSPAAFQAQDAAFEMRIVRQAGFLRRECGRDRALAGAAGENHLAAVRIGNLHRIEGRQRQHERRRDRPRPRPRSARARRPAGCGPRSSRAPHPPRSGLHDRRFPAEPAHRPLPFAQTHPCAPSTDTSCRSAGEPSNARRFGDRPVHPIRPSPACRPPPPVRSESGRSRWRRSRSWPAR